MRGPQLVPQSDLLSQVDGVERQLRKAKKLGLVGWTAFLVFAVQFVLLVLLESGAVSDANGTPKWLLVGTILALGLALLLVNWTRLWLHESREPFRYTYSVDDFEPVGTGVPGRAPEPLAWLRHDLSARLSARIGRLDLLEERYSGATAQPESHVHIGGTYGIRRKPDGMWTIEVLPWIRLGPTGSPARLAHSVEFSLGSRAPTVDVAGYEKLRERIYFSIATELYRQIRKDVQSKINFLPRRYFRAAAYFHEAKDYARSNTLDSYDPARELYAAVLRLYDPRRWPPLDSAGRRRSRRLAALRPSFSLAWRRQAAKLSPRLGRIELMVGRAEIEYANALLDRRMLAGMSGHRLNPIFEALPVAERAMKRIDKLPPDVPRRRDALFDAYVTRAATASQLNSLAKAKEFLAKAEGLDPERADRNARFLYVRGGLEARQEQAVQFLRRAVELAPGFEAAQFALATALEMFWRTRPTLERNVAMLVADEYDRVLALNPGNIAAWANLGYIHWLLGDLRRSEQCFSRGRDYKDIKHETFVAELDYGLARIAAEGGDFREAYRHYISAVSALFAQGVSHAPGGYTGYHFERIDRAMVMRFHSYVRSVRARWAAVRDAGDERVPRRVADSVYAFVLNDYGEACFNYYLRAHDERYLDLALEALEEAELQLKTRYPMLYLNLYRVLRWRGEPDEERIDRVISRVVEYAPNWPDGLLERAVWNDYWAASSADRAQQLEDRATRSKDEAGRASEEAKRRHAALRVSPLAAPAGADEPTLVTWWSELLEQRVPTRVNAMESPPVPTGTPLSGDVEVVTLGQPDADLPQLLSSRAEAGFRPPLPADPEDSHAEIELLHERARSLREEAKELRREAHRARLRAKRLFKEAIDAPLGLLPHDWLWGDAERRTLEWKLLDRSDVGLQRKLERELDELHVRALVAWCTRGIKRSSIDAPRRALLLNRLADGFLPGDFSLLWECRQLSVVDEDTIAGYETEMRTIIERWVAVDPAWWSLRFLVESETRDLFTSEQVAGLLRRAVAARGLPESLYVWLGERLFELGEQLEADGDRDADAAEACRSAALEAYERARGGSDPAILFELGRTLERRGLFRECVRAFRRSRELAQSWDDEAAPGRLPDPDDYRRALAVALWKAGETRHAIAELSAIDAEVLSPTVWRSRLVSRLLDDGGVRTPEEYRPLKDWLGRVVTRAELADEREVLRDAADALLELTLRRYQSVVRRPHDRSFPREAASMNPGVTPISIEGDTRLFPVGEPPQRLATMLDPSIGDLAKLQRRIGHEMGIEIPSVAVAPVETALPGRYWVLVNEVPVAAGEAAGTRFSPDGLRCRELGLGGLESPVPGSGAEGLWIDEAAEPPDDLPVWDVYTYIVKHLEAVLDRNLSPFLGFQEVVDLLDRWEHADPDARHERRKLRRRSVPDDRATVRLTAVLQALAKEDVPITNLGRILAAFESSTAAADAVEQVELVRAAVSSELPGADAAGGLFRMSVDLESTIAAWTHVRDGKHFVALPGTEAEQLRRLLRKELRAAAEHNFTLVVCTPGLRPAVRQLVALDHPNLTVASLSELPQVRLDSAGWRGGSTRLVHT